MAVKLSPEAIDVLKEEATIRMQQAATDYSMVPDETGIAESLHAAAEVYGVLWYARVPEGENAVEVEFSLEPKSGFAYQRRGAMEALASVGYERDWEQRHTYLLSLFNRVLGADCEPIAA